MSDRGHEIDALRLTVEALVREKDEAVAIVSVARSMRGTVPPDAMAVRALTAEARADQLAAEVEHWRVNAAAVGVTDGHALRLDMERLTGERDASIAESQRNRESILRLMREVDSAQAALRMVEWVTTAMAGRCPWCGQFVEDGHARDCVREVALGERLKGGQ